MKHSKAHLWSWRQDSQVRKTRVLARVWKMFWKINWLQIKLGHKSIGWSARHLEDWSSTKHNQLGFPSEWSLTERELKFRHEHEQHHFGWSFRHGIWRPLISIEKPFGSWMIERINSVCWTNSVGNHQKSNLAFSDQ